MTDQDNEAPDEPRTRRSRQEYLAVPVLIAGGLLTLSWMAVLIAATLQIVGAIAGTGSHG